MITGTPCYGASRYILVYLMQDGCVLVAVMNKLHPPASGLGLATDTFGLQNIGCSLTVTKSTRAVLPTTSYA